MPEPELGTGGMMDHFQVLPVVVGPKVESVLFVGLDDEEGVVGDD